MKSKFSLPHQEPVYLIDYEIHSAINYTDVLRYNVRINGVITKPSDTDRRTLVGYIEAYKVLMDAAQAEGFDMMSLFDYFRETMEVGELVYDFRQEDWNELVKRYYNDQISGQSMLILAQLEILPKFRGKGVGKRAIKDLWINFGDGNTPISLDCFPFQFMPESQIRNRSFRKEMKYDEMEQDREKAFIKLQAYLETIGFEPIPGLEQSIMILNPMTVDDRFNSIELD